MSRKKISSKKISVNVQADAIEKSKRSRYQWSNRKENTMLNVLKSSQLNDDVKTDFDFKSSMIFVVFNVIAFFIISSNVSQMKNKYNDFKKNWKNWKKMLKLSKFDKSDDETMIVDDEIWIVFLIVKNNENYKKFKDRALQREKTLRYLFVDVIITKFHVVTTKDFFAADDVDVDVTTFNDDVDVEKKIDENTFTQKIRNEIESDIDDDSFTFVELIVHEFEKKKKK